MALAQWQVEQIIRRTGKLPPMPHVAQKALALIRNPRSNMGGLAEVLALDQAMAGLVLRWANSAYFGLIHQVSTVHQAVVYLGHNAIRSLVLTASVSSFMERPAPGYGLARGELWKHAVGVAGAARLIAARFGPAVAEEAYHAGLLCDIGKLAFEVLLQGVETNALEWQERSFSDLEEAHFGIGHAALGAELVRQWNLPRALVDAIACHHSPAQAREGAVLAAAVHVADAAMMALGIGLGCDGLRYALDPQACERMGWSEASFGQLVERVGALVAEAEAFIQWR